MWIQLAALTAGGAFIGAISRYLCTVWTAKRFPSPFPYGTLTVNVTGSLFIGLLAGWKPNDELAAFAVIGFLGAYTTFSTFVIELIHIWRKKRYTLFLVYTLATFLSGIAAAYGGWILANYF